MATRLPSKLPPVFTYREAIGAGLTKHRFYRLRDAGVIEPVARGLYRQADADDLVDLDLLEISRRAHRATLCLTTALVHHDLTDANPSSIDVAVPAATHRPKTTAPVTWHTFDRATFDVGRTTMPVGAGHRIGIYGPERCIIDAFRLRHREGDELANVALRRWLRRRGNSPAVLYGIAAQHFPQAVPALVRTLEILQYE